MYVSNHTPKRGFAPYHFSYVYVLTSTVRAGEIYIGCTGDLRKRLSEHNDGEVLSTKRYAPWRLAYYEAFSEEESAWKREKRLKNNANAMLELKKRIGLPVTQKSGKGFVALLSVIILCFVFLAAVISLGQFGLAGRLLLLDFENKAKSEEYAEACVHIARILVANDPEATRSGVDITTNGILCTLVSLTHSGGNSTIRTRAEVEGATTNFTVVVDSNTADVISWKETET